MTAVDTLVSRYARVRPRMVEAVLRRPALAHGLLRARNSALAAVGRPEHAARLKAAVHAASVAGGTDVVGVRTWPRGALRWVVLDGLPTSASSQYRVEALRRSLKASGHDVAVVSPDDLGRRARAFMDADVVVLFRVGTGDTLRRLVSGARAAGALVVYDTDDLVFDPAVANEDNVDGMRFLSPGERSLYVQGVLDYREALQLADVVTVPTASLARAAEATGRRALVVRNSLVGAWADAESPQPEADGPVIIGYASGTRTHQRDFARAAEGIAQALASSPQVELHVVGDLDLSEFPVLQPYSSRITRLPLVPFDQLPAVMTTFAVNIAPLEDGNPYCEAKSELKFFEAGVLGVPTVASPTEPYRAVLDGTNGFLAGGDDDWAGALVRLCNDADLRRRTGEAARATALRSFGPAAHAQDVAELERALRAMTGGRDDEVVTMVLPGIDAGSGGANKALDLFSGLARPGRVLQLVVQDRTATFSTAASVDRRYGLSAQGIAVIMGDDVVVSSDVTVTTYYTTAHAVASAGTAAGRVVQLLQDYEPLFFPMSEKHLAARASLELPHAQVSYGPWVAAVLRESHGRTDTGVLPYFIDPDLYRPCCEESLACTHAASCDGHVVRLAFLARPEMPRRCYPLAVEALALAKERMGDRLDVIAFGSEQTRSVRPGFPHTDLGVVSPQELALLYRGCDLGLVISPTNPSMVPFEMMASGLAVVDVDVRFNAENYGGRDNVLLAAPTPDALADTICRAADDVVLRRDVAARGTTWARSLPTRSQVLAHFSDLLDELVER